MTEADFSGYVTKAGLRCSDGRTITAEAFKHQDKVRVPLVYQHGHAEITNVLGHVDLEAREDGIYGYGYFNETKQGETARELVKHEDITMMSIFANQLAEKNKIVLHGFIREVSLVLSGANPGAKIDYIRVAHADGYIDEDAEVDVAIIHTGLQIEHGQRTHTTKSTTTTQHLVDGVVKGTNTETSESTRTHETDDETSPGLAYSDIEHAEGDDKESLDDIFNSMTPKQQDYVKFVVGAALEDADDDDEGSEGGSAAQSSIDTDDSTSTTSATSTDTPDEGAALTHQEGSTTVSRVFDQSATGTPTKTLSHADCMTLLSKAKEAGSFKEAFLSFATENELSHSELAHSITSLELMFPEAQSVSDDPQFITRRMEWVSSVLAGTRKAPFSNIKTLLADITADEARAKGYVKGNQKVEEVLTLLRRSTKPTTIYKKQALDRDDLIDITDFNVVLWLKAEMRMMIEEELARCILVGDGRSAVSPDKVKDPMGSTDGVGIRSILHDSDLYSVKVDMAANVNAKEAVKGLVRARSKFRGSGKPTLFISDAFLTEIMLEEDKFGRPLYETEAVLRDKLRVSNIVTVDLLDDHQDLFAIMVSLSDYTIGATKGGELTSFEDFDIDFNKHKYLQETRLSGALTKPFSAVVVRRLLGTLAVATAPSFDGATNTVTVPSVTGVYYTVNDEVVTGQIVITGPTEFTAHAADDHYLEFNTTRTWTYAP